MAEKRLRSDEKKLMQDKSLAHAYQSTIDDYIRKGYIREVPEMEPKPATEWFLPHFPVVRPEKSTTKVRIVFDGSAQQDGKSLNTESLPEFNMKTYPLGARAVLEHCYMDDLMLSTPTVEEAKETRKQLTELSDKAGFYIRKSKLLMQKAWLEAGAWDDLLPKHHQQEWIKWFRELSDLKLVKIPRCLKDPVAKVVELSIHTFTDASESAYAAAVYARHVYENDDVTVRLIASKFRLAPLKAVSIPRLELLGALIGTRLTMQICSALKISTDEVTYWVDSMNVGYWIRGQSREYKPFIAHRVGEIHECSAPSQWRYVPTNANPADYGTRGLAVEDLASTGQWWNGPEFLKRAEEEWPECKFDPPTSEEGLELKRGKEISAKETCSYATIKEGGENIDSEIASEEGVWRLNPSRYSKWFRVKRKGDLEFGLSLVRVRAWVHRFNANCRRPADQRLKGELTPFELSDAEEAIVREVQTKTYGAEMEALRKIKQIPRQSTLAPLNPVLLNGILRSKTRLQNADDLLYEVKCPIILPKEIKSPD
ncbi:hypothetical protein AWC38_SpisGene16828 [Stylophora pistillata]|uniref:Uncharacterized protein n=1 Tax=Stylophora pistillata TaxID=50429 RepID=A0A2B4RNP8_STYPI|nr:hypothetical protein AWC38_SpisGene16828 [Stylophora pistillata]